MTPLAPHLTAFLRERLPVERQVSVHTCASYAYAFQLLVTFASERLQVPPAHLVLEQLDAPLILAFLAQLETQRGNRPSSRNVRLAAIKAFMRFLQYRVPSALEQIRQILAIPVKKTDRRLVNYLTREEMQALLNAPAPTTMAGVRDRAMLDLAYAGGLRVSELVGLRLDECIFQPQPCIRVRGKGRRERVLPLWKETTEALRAWLAIRGTPPVPEVFVNARGDAMTRSGFAYILATHVATATTTCPSLQAKRVSPHVLRHSCAMLTLHATHDVRKVALWLGHASVQTTEIYLQADPSQRLEILDSVVPPTLRRGTFQAPDKLLALLQSPKMS